MMKLRLKKKEKKKKNPNLSCVKYVKEAKMVSRTTASDITSESQP